MIEGCKYFLDKKYKKVKYCTLLRHFRSNLRKFEKYLREEKGVDFNKIVYSWGIKKFEHPHLTKYCRNFGNRDIPEITGKSNVDLHLGALPPELLKLVKKEEVAQKTKEFCEALDNLTLRYAGVLNNREHQTYEISEIGDIFGTHCVIQTYQPVDELGLSRKEWAGAFGDVYKLCFPEIGVEYALKVYKNVEKEYKEHGAFYEIPTAFCANKITPKENNPVYLGRLHRNGYMISKWQEKRDGYSIHYGLFPVFETSDQESDYRKYNFINGLRIDFGETSKTWYGNLSYNARKWYRTMEYVDLPTIKQEYAKVKTNFDKDDFYEATKLHFLEYVRSNRLRLTRAQIEDIDDLIAKKEFVIFDKYFKKVFPEQCR